MEKQTKNDLIEAYRAAYDAIPKEALELDILVTVKTMQALAEGVPVSPNRLAELWGMPLAQVNTVLNQAAANGQAQVDSDGNLVGGVLSLVPTPHRISLDENQLYAWCAYDAIYAPGVVGKTALIDSRDPVTGDAIRLIITPDGVSKVWPKGTVVSIVTETDTRGGPESPRCSQMNFFGSRESAQIWLKDNPGVSILKVDEAFDIAMQFQIEPARRLGLVPFLGAAAE